MHMRTLSILFLITAAAFLLYASAISGGYVMDDTFLVRDNHFLDSASNFVSFFTSGTAEFGRPVRLLSFYVDTALFGKSTVAYHTSNILYYSVLCLLIFLFARSLFRTSWFALAVTLLFLAHPLHTEAVAYISGRKDILGALFTVASIICLLRFFETHAARDGLLVALFLLLAITSKETYAVAPLLFLAAGVYRGENLRRYASWFFVLLVAAALFLLYVVFIRNRVLFNYLETIPVFGNNQGINLPTAIVVCATCIRLALLPWPLSADYTYNALPRSDFLSPAFHVSILVLALLAGAAYRYRRSRKELSFGLLWMGICLLPVCHIVPYPEIISERSLLLLSAGACIVFASLLHPLPPAWRTGALVLLLSVFSAATVSRNAVWHDSLSLWSATVQTHPACARARYNLGCALAKNRRYPEAQEQFTASLQINPPGLTTVPDYSLDALVNLGNVRVQLRDYAGAERCYREVLRYDPAHPFAGMNLEKARTLKNAATREFPEPAGP